jgi:hypothetical protein
VCPCIEGSGDFLDSRECWEGSAMDGCRKDDGTLLDLLAAEQAALSKCLDVERKAHDLT